jgi:hypothetical protein
MKAELKKIIWGVLRKLHIGGIVQLSIKSALIEDGWFRSFNKKESVDKNGNPIPWLTYSAIKFIETRLKKEFKIFEYGCGNSTIWFSKKVHSIISVEHDETWMNYVKGRLPDNAMVFLYELNNNHDYAKSIQNFQKKFHIIIIDGRERNDCVKYCIEQLTNDGVIIFDNTQVTDYMEGIDFLVNQGFKKIDFEGILPIVSYNNTTSIFYKNDNCFNI